MAARRLRVKVASPHSVGGYVPTSDRHRCPAARNVVRMRRSTPIGLVDRTSRDGRIGTDPSARRHIDSLHCMSVRLGCLPAQGAKVPAQPRFARG